MQSRNIHCKLRMVFSLLLGLALVYGIVECIERNTLWLVFLMGLSIFCIFVDLLVLYKKKVVGFDRVKYLYWDAVAVCVWWILFVVVDRYFSLGVICTLATINLVNNILYHLRSR